MLGILIDNACEKVLEDEKEEKRIRVVFRESNESIKISVSNPSQKLSYSEIDKLFEEGYSSKGENRGLGLARCLQLVKKYNADIVVQNVMFNEMNWIKFSIVL